MDNNDELETFEGVTVDISKYDLTNVDTDLANDIRKVDEQTKDIVANTEVTSSGILEDANDDYKKVRESYYNLVESGQNALRDLLSIASSSEHPRAFEVASMLIKTISDTNEKIINLQKQMRDIEKLGIENEITREEKENGGQTVNNNAIFVGSMKDFQKMIESMQGNDYSETGIDKYAPKETDTESDS